MSPRLSTLAASAALALPLLALTPAANADVEGTLIDFERDEDFNGRSTTSVDHEGVTFCEVGGGGIFIEDVGLTEAPYSSGKTLYVWNGLAMSFSAPTASLDLSFGNDLFGPTSDAVLSLYLGEDLVDTVRVPEGGDAMVNQTIGYSGHAFNRATLAWNEPGIYGVLVDNILVGAPVEAPNPVVDCEKGAPVAPELVLERCTIVGTSEADVLVGTPERDVICGRGGDDVIKGLGGDDLLIGGAGDDKLRGFGGDDEVRGNAGRDLMWGGAGTDTALGGDGLDLAFDFEVLQSVRSGD